MRIDRLYWGTVIGACVALMVAARANAQVHTTGLAITNSCVPNPANEGAQVTCTVTVRNLDSDHDLAALSVTSTYPFPGGSAVSVSGCATTLSPGDGMVGGPDTTTCSVDITLDEPCTGAQISSSIEVAAEGVDGDPIGLPTGYGGLPVSGSASDTVDVTCATTQANHYLCRQVKDLKVPAKFVAVAGISVVDQTGTDTCEAKKPFLLCDPVDKNGGGIVDPALHYCCYKLKCTQKPAVSYDVTDQFWNGRIQTKKPKFLCNPCQKAPA